MNQNEFNRNNDPLTLEEVTTQEPEVVEEGWTGLFNIPEQITIGQNKRNVMYGVMFGLGVLFGLVVLGWNLWPVEWEFPNTIDHLPTGTKSLIVTTVGDNLTYSGDSSYASHTMYNLSNNPNELLCELLVEEQDPYNRAVILQLQFQITGRNQCP